MFPDGYISFNSLPSNMDQGDLTRMLMEHLSGHTQIKNIKVVRDSKGGVCAFVQCEARQDLIILPSFLIICALECCVGYGFDSDFTCQSSEAFSWSYLTLWTRKGFQNVVGLLQVGLSHSFTCLQYYIPTLCRTPTQYGSFPSPGHAQIKLELPTAMRIWKHRNSRYIGYLYHWPSAAVWLPPGFTVCCTIRMPYTQKKIFPKTRWIFLGMLFFSIHCISMKGYVISYTRYLELVMNQDIIVTTQISFLFWSFGKFCPLGDSRQNRLALSHQSLDLFKSVWLLVLNRFWPRWTRPDAS